MGRAPDTRTTDTSQGQRDNATQGTSAQAQHAPGAQRDTPRPPRQTVTQQLSHG